MTQTHSLQTTFWKHWGKWRNCSWWAISPFATMFLNSIQHILQSFIEVFHIFEPQQSCRFNLWLKPFQCTDDFMSNFSFCHNVFNYYTSTIALSKYWHLTTFENIVAKEEISPFATMFKNLFNNLNFISRGIPYFSI